MRAPCSCHARYGGAKNYLGHSKRNLRNYYLYANLGASPICMVDDSGNAQDTYANNTCVRQCDL